MTISVIIPTFDEARTISDTLLHTASLGFDELVVVDGGSSDQTRTIVETFMSGTQRSAHCTVRLLSAARGRAAQLNAGAQASRGDVLLFLHADTYLPVLAKHRIVVALADTGIVGGRFDVRFDRPSMLGRIISTLMNYRSRWSGIFTGDQAIFVRRDTFERLGGFADIPLMEDIDFSTRLKRTGQTEALRETVTTSFRRWEQQGPLKTILLMWTLRFLYWMGVSPQRLKTFYATVR
jgi:rSAM/selenodomain-associated transferase 2